MIELEAAMLKQKKILLLWIFLSMVIFSSCDDVVKTDINLYSRHPLPKQNIEIIKMSFAKVYIYPYYWMSWDDEFKIGDTIALTCNIYDAEGTWYNLPKSVTARTTKSRESVTDVGFIELFENHYVGYAAIVPHPPFLYNSNFIILSSKSFRSGDVLTAEINAKNKILKTTLTIK